MASIDPVAYGKELRPSTIGLMKKLNEVIEVVNDLDPSSVTTLKTDVSSLKTNVGTLQTQMVAANSNITQNTNDIADLDTDMQKVKVTLYTPLAQSE